MENIKATLYATLGGGRGPDGKSAYEVALDNGYIGTVTQWLASLAQGAPEFAETEEEFTDTSKMYVLPDGYIYAYCSKAVLVNQFDAEVAQLNKRLAYTAAQNSVLTEETYNAETAPQGSYVAWAGGLSTNYIPTELCDVVVSGFSGTAVDVFSTNAGGAAIEFFDEDKKYIGYRLIYSSSGGWGFNDVTVDDESHSVVFDLNTLKSVTSTVYNNNVSQVLANAKYFRFNCNPTGAKATITSTDIADFSVQLDTSSGSSSEYAWRNTGLPYAPADYDEDVVALKNIAEDHEVRISNIEETVETGADTVPSYWKTELSEIISDVKEKQRKIGINGVSFVMAADMHVDGSLSANVCENLGKLSRDIMKECNVPFLVVAGDNNSGAAVVSETPDRIYSDIDRQDKILKYIDKNKILKLLGNHDGVWGQTTTGGNTAYYDKSLSESERFDLFMSGQGDDFRRSWGEDGTYFYVDFQQRKTRFICLNSLDMPYTVGEDHGSENNPMKNMGYSAAEVKWFGASLSVPDGWHIIILSHIPPTLKSVPKGTVNNEDVLRGMISAYCGRTSYTGSVGSESLSFDFAEETGTVVGIFAGHLHFDMIDEDTLPCPIVVTTTAGATEIDPDTGNVISRTYGSVNETAFDVVTVDFETETVYLTRVGSGNDRRVEYNKEEVS